MALLISLIAFGIYLLGLAPTIGAGDSGELVAAAANLGIAHPSGYPLYCLIGKCFFVGFPFASAAYRINLVSAFFSAATAGIIYQILSLNGQNRWLKASLSLAIVFLPVFWTQATVSEVFALNIFLSAALIWIVCAEAGFLLFFFLLGLGLGNHQTIALVALGVLLPYLGGLFRKKRFLFFGVLFFLLGYSVNLYLMLRSSQQPLINWSNPSSWTNFLRVITRADYGTFRLHQEIQTSVSMSMVLAQLKHFFQYLIFIPFGWWGWLGALCTAICLYKRKSTKSEWAALLLTGPAFVLLSRLPMDAWSKAVISRFYLPASLIYYLWAAKGILSVMRKARFGLRIEKTWGSILEAWSSGALSLLCLLLPVYLIFYNLTRNSQRQNFFVYDYGKNILRTLPPNSTLFIEKIQDDAVFSLIYLACIERRRNDCRFYESEVRIFPIIYGADYVGLAPAQRLLRRREIQKQLLALTGNPVYFLATSRDDLKQFFLYRQGLLLRADKKPFSPLSTKPADIFWPLYNYRGVGFNGEPGGRDLDYRTRSLVVSYPLERADYYRLAGKKEPALVDGQLVERLGDDIDWVQNNLGNFYRLLGELEKAKRCLILAIEQKPDYDIAWYNLGLVYETEKNWPKSFEAYQKAWQIVPQDPDVLSRLELASLYWAYQLGAENKKAQALHVYEFVKTINPHQPISYYNSAALYEQLGNLQKSQEELEKYRSLGDKDGKK